MLPYRPKARQELRDGYAEAAILARQRKDQMAASGDKAEAMAWAKIESYCDMMANCGFTDEPDNSRVNYLPLDERIIDRRVLQEIIDDAEDGTNRSWTKYHQMAYAAAMALLSPTERTVCEMYYGAQVKREDISEALGYSRMRVAKAIERAREKWAELRQEDKNTPPERV